jgi:hypothetical protein
MNDITPVLLENLPLVNGNYDERKVKFKFNDCKWSTVFFCLLASSILAFIIALCISNIKEFIYPISSSQCICGINTNLFTCGFDHYSLVTDKGSNETFASCCSYTSCFSTNSMKVKPMRGYFFDSSVSEKEAQNIFNLSNTIINDIYSNWKFVAVQISVSYILSLLFFLFFFFVKSKECVFKTCYIISIISLLSITAILFPFYYNKGYYYILPIFLIPVVVGIALLVVLVKMFKNDYYFEFGALREVNSVLHGVKIVPFVSFAHNIVQVCVYYFYFYYYYIINIFISLLLSSLSSLLSSLLLLITSFFSAYLR